MKPASYGAADFLGRFFTNRNLFQSDNAGETIRACTRALGAHRMLSAAGELSSSFKGLACDDFAIIRLRHSSPVTIEPQVTDDYIVHHKLSGGGYLQGAARRIEMTPGVITVTSPGQVTRVGMRPDSVSVVVRLPRRKVMRCVQDMLQRSITKPVIFDMEMQPKGSTAAAWCNALQHVCEQYETLSRWGNVGSGLAGRFAEYMAGLLLEIQPHSHTAHLAEGETAIPLRYVREARDYLHGNISEPFSIAALARVTGVSTRTLQAGFKRCFGQTPTEYLRDQRIRLVHEELISAGPDTRVTEVFMRFGIADFGRYARFYRERYGVLPSEHLKAARRRTL
jgi:AraC-like DNA-binding protein